MNFNTLILLLLSSVALSKPHTMPSRDGLTTAPAHSSTTSILTNAAAAASKAATTHTNVWEETVAAMTKPQKDRAKINRVRRESASSPATVEAATVAAIDSSFHAAPKKSQRAVKTIGDSDIDWLSQTSVEDEKEEQSLSDDLASQDTISIFHPQDEQISFHETYEQFQAKSHSVATNFQEDRFTDVDSVAVEIDTEMERADGAPWKQQQRRNLGFQEIFKKLRKDSPFGKKVLEKGQKVEGDGSGAPYEGIFDKLADLSEKNHPFDNFPGMSMRLLRTTSNSGPFGEKRGGKIKQAPVASATSNRL